MSLCVYLRRYYLFVFIIPCYYPLHCICFHSFKQRLLLHTPDDSLQTFQMSFSRHKHASRQNNTSQLSIGLRPAGTGIDQCHQVQFPEMHSILDESMCGLVCLLCSIGLGLAELRCKARDQNINSIGKQDFSCGCDNL